MHITSKRHRTCGCGISRISGLINCQMHILIEFSQGQGIIATCRRALSKHHVNEFRPPRNPLLYSKTVLQEYALFFILCISDVNACWTQPLREFFFFLLQIIPWLTEYYRAVVNMYMCRPRKIVQLKTIDCRSLMRLY